MTDAEDENGTRDSVGCTYPTCALDQSQRQLISRLYGAWKGLGWKPGDFDLLLETAGFPIPRRTLNRWTSAAEETDDSSPPPQKRGRPALIDEAGAEVLVGYCISRVSSGQGVHLQTVVDFCRDYLDIGISLPTASSILAKYGFSSRIAQVSSSGICVEPTKLAKICSDWIKMQRKAGLFSGEPLLLGSIDFTFTKHTTTRQTSFALQGG